MVYVFFAISFILFFVDSLSDNFTIGDPGGDYYMNAPYAIASKVTFMCLLGAFMTVAFTNAAALRDFDSKYDQILFATPINKKAYVFGRFLSSVTVSWFTAVMHPKWSNTNLLQALFLLFILSLEFLNLSKTDNAK